MNPTPLSQIAEWVGGRIWAGDSTVSVTRVCTDSRSIQKGDLFVALRGDNFDGHRFVSSVSQVGAAGALVAEPPNDVRPDFALIQVQDTLAGLQRLSGAYRSSLNTEVVAITGSNGKTSTKDFTAAVLGRRFRTAKTKGNLNNHIGVPLTLLDLEEADEVAVVEMGMNHPGEIAPLAALAKPTVAIITNIGVAHIEYMGSRNAIAQEKGTLAEAVPAGGTVILNAEDDMSEGIAARCAAKVITAGIARGDVRATQVRTTQDGMEFQLEYQGGAVSAFVPVFGEHMVRNALLACGAGLALGMKLQACAEGLKALDLSKGRLQRKMIHGCTILDDTYNANPDSVVAGLSTLMTLPGSGRRFAVLGRMGELGSEAEAGHRRVGHEAGELGVSGVIAVGAEASWIAEAARAAGVSEVILVENTEAAAEKLRTLLQPGDIVLIKGSRSSKMEQVIAVLESGGKN